MMSWSVPIIEANTTTAEEESKKLDALLLNNELLKNNKEFSDMNDDLNVYLNNSKLMGYESSQKIDESIDAATEKYMTNPVKFIGGSDVGGMLSAMTSSGGKSHLEFSTMLNYHLKNIDNDMKVIDDTIKTM